MGSDNSGRIFGPEDHRIQIQQMALHVRRLQL